MDKKKEQEYKDEIKRLKKANNKLREENKKYIKKD